MDNLFSFLGKFSDYHFLNKDNKNIIENLSSRNLLCWSDISFDNKKVTVDDVVKKAKDACRIFSFEIFNDISFKNYLLNDNNNNIFIKTILTNFKNDFNTIVNPVFEEELRFIMIAANEYSRSLYRININNGTRKSPAKYISVFDKKNHEIRKFIENSVNKFNETDQNKVFQNNKEISDKLYYNTKKTVLPHFIRRFYDPILLKRAPIMQSIYDIGPIMGLIGVSTKLKNPYLINMEKEEDEQFEKKSTISLTQSFLNSFSCVPYSLYKKDKNSLTISSIDALQECKDIAEKEQFIKYNHSSIDFLNSINAEELSVFEQFIVERLTHGCFLSKAYNLQFCLQNNACINYYLDQIVSKLILLPLPRTRIQILICLENFINNYISIEKELNNNLSPIVVLIALDSLTEELINIINFWIDIVIPIHIICYNFLCTNNDLEIDARDYFKLIYDKYQFYQIDEKENVDISDLMNLTPIKTYVTQKGNKFDNYSRKLYHYFLVNTYKYAFDINFSNQLSKFECLMSKYSIEL